MYILQVIPLWQENGCARTNTVFLPISEVSKGTVSLNNLDLLDHLDNIDILDNPAQLDHLDHFGHPDHLDLLDYLNHLYCLGCPDCLNELKKLVKSVISGITDKPRNKAIDFVKCIEILSNLIRAKLRNLMRQNILA